MNNVSFPKQIEEKFEKLEFVLKKGSIVFCIVKVSQHGRSPLIEIKLKLQSVSKNLLSLIGHYLESCLLLNNIMMPHTS